MIFNSTRFSFSLLLNLIVFIFVSSCNVNDSNNVKQLYQKYNGTWRPVRSVTDHPVDLDLDGDASIFMFDEISDWDTTTLTIRIIEDPIGDGDYPHLLDVPYPVQSFPPESEFGESGFFINYPIKRWGWGFTLNQTKDSLLIEHYLKRLDKEEFPYPKYARFINNGLIFELVIEKRLLTADGWQEVEITTRYARITINT